MIKASLKHAIVHRGATRATIACVQRKCMQPVPLGAFHLQTARAASYQFADSERSAPYHCGNKVEFRLQTTLCACAPEKVQNDVSPSRTVNASWPMSTNTVVGYLGDPNHSASQRLITLGKAMEPTEIENCAIKCQEKRPRYD